MVGPARFGKVAKSYVEKLLAEGNGSKRQYGHARHAKGVVERYLVPCFGDAAIGAIRLAKIAEYKEWRRNYWTIGPGENRADETYERNGEDVKFVPQTGQTSDATIKRELNFLRGVFKHAVDNGYIKQGDIPKVSIEKAKSQKRPAFTKEDFSARGQTAIQRYQDACNLDIPAGAKADRGKQLANKTN